MESDKASSKAKSYLVAAVLALLFGWCGAHCFYLKKGSEAWKHIIFTFAMFVLFALFENNFPMACVMAIGPLESVLFVLTKRVETPIELIQAGKLLDAIAAERKRAKASSGDIEETADGRGAKQKARHSAYMKPGDLAVIVMAAFFLLGSLSAATTPYASTDSSSPHQTEEQMASTSAISDESASPQAATTSDADEAASYDNGSLSVTFVDVGQGDAAIIELPDGGSIVVDAGPDTEAKALEEELTKRKIDKIDHLVATHGDSDHIAGMIELLSSHEVGEFMAPQVTDTTDSYLEVLEAVDSKGISSRAAWAGRCVTQGKNYSVKVLSPIQDQDYSESNDWSVVLLVTYGETNMLLTGDAPKEILKSVDCETVDLLKVSHHGSSTGTDAELFEKLQPKYAVISYAIGNEYGHPTQEVLNSLSGATVYGTGANGTITAKSDGKELTVTGSKSGSVVAPVDETPTDSSESAGEGAEETQAEEPAQEAPAAQEKTVVVTPSGAKYHNRGCRTIKKSKSLTELTVSEAQAQGYTACGVCNP